MTTSSNLLRSLPVWLILALLSVAGHTRAEPWPVTPTHQQGSTTGVVGEARSAIRSHQGTDITGQRPEALMSTATPSRMSSTTAP